MVHRIAIIPVSPNTLDKLYAVRVHRSSEFFEDVTGSMERSFLLKRAEQERCKLLGRIKKMRILINRFYMGQEREIMFLLAHSASPVSDIVNLSGLCLKEVHRKINYLRRVSVEFYRYFDRKTYQQADLLLKKFLTPVMYTIFHVIIICRNEHLAARLLGRCYQTVQRTVIRIKHRIDREAEVHDVIRDVCIAWRRIDIIRKSYYGSWKKCAARELEKVEGEANYEYSKI